MAPELGGGVMDDQKDDSRWGQENHKMAIRREIQSRCARVMGTGVVQEGNVFYVVDVERAYERFLKRPVRRVRDDHQ